MKKFFVYFVFIVFVLFVLPVFLTRRSGKSDLEVKSMDIKIESDNSQKEDDGSDNEQKINGDGDKVEVGNTSDNYKYDKYGEIRLLHADTQEIETVNIDEYLYNVVSAEMPVTFEMEALKAQAIVARTYTIYKIQNPKHENADICTDSNCCQAWVSKEKRFERWEQSKRESNWDRIKEVVNSTKGKIIVYRNKPINAFFHSNSGGITEIPINVWGGSGYPYLKSVETAGEEKYEQYASEVVFNKQELIDKMKTKYLDISIEKIDGENIKIVDYTESKRVRTLKIGNHSISGVEVRNILGLKSTNFEIVFDGESVKFLVKGYGHGVGMSQTGADSMAKSGSSAEDIILHFYSDVEVKDVNFL